jgi:Bacterial PH domain
VRQCQKCQKPSRYPSGTFGTPSGSVFEEIIRSSQTFIGITSKRIIFQDNAWVTGTKAVVSIPYSRIHTVAAEDAVGLFTGRGFFSSSKIIITTSAGTRIFQFRGADKAHIAHDLILQHIV